MATGARLPVPELKKSPPGRACPTLAGGRGGFMKIVQSCHDPQPGIEDARHSVLRNVSTIV